MYDHGRIGRNETENSKLKDNYGGLWTFMDKAQRVVGYSVPPLVIG